MERKTMQVKLAKKLLDGNRKGRVFLTAEGKKALENIVLVKQD